MEIEINIIKINFAIRMLFYHRSNNKKIIINKTMDKYRQILKKYFLKIVVLIFLLTIVFLGFVNIRLQQQVNNLKDQTKIREQELVTKDEDLQLCYSDRAKVKEESKQIYSPQEFKISSPLFEGQEMTIKTLNYKGSEIKEMSINLPANDERAHLVNIKVWDYVNVPNQKTARFNDYYSAFPLWAETVTGEEPAYYKYVTSNGFNMRRSCGELSMSKSITSINSIYVVISGYQCTGIYLGQEEKTIRESTKYIEKVADTIFF